MDKEAENGRTTSHKKLSKLRQIIPQICAIGAENFVLLATGSFYGYITIILDGLKRNKEDIPTEESDLSWLSTVSCISAPIGCLLSGPISTYLGRKRIMQLSMIPYAFMWLMTYYSRKLISLYLAFLLVGLVRGTYESSTANYIAEVTQPRVRGILLSFMSTAILIGISMQSLVGLFTTDWRTAALISMIYPVLAFISLSFVPESPYWLAGKGRVEDAERALCWLRGWVSPSEVQKELTMIRNTSDNPAGDSEDSETMKTKFWVKFTEREFVRPFGLTLLCFFIGCCGGSSAVLYHSIEIFKQNNSPIDGNVAYMFLNIAQLIASVVSVAAIYFMGKRIINFASIGGTALCYFGVPAYLYLDGHSCSWIPMILIIGGGFFSNVGIKSLPWILLGEIFPLKVKSIATGILVASFYLFEAVATGTYHGIFNMMGSSGTFLLFGGINAAGLILLYFALPETEQRTLHDIKLHYNGTRSLKDKSRTGEE